MLARREAARFRKEVNSTLVDRPEVGMGGEAGVAHHLSWQSGVPVFPKLNDPQDFIIVIRFAHAGMGIDQHVHLGIPRQIRLQSVQGAIPTIHEACTGLWIRLPGVLGET